MSKQNHTSGGSFLFKVEVLVEAPNNGAALEQLLRALNAGDFADYRIASGIQLGAVIEQALANAKPQPAAEPKATNPQVAQALARAARSAPAAAPKEAAKESVKSDPLEVRIRQFIQSNRLIRININKGLGVKMNIPCRVINFDAATQMLTVYHVDEKQVYTVRLNEIDDFIE